MKNQKIIFKKIKKTAVLLLFTCSIIGPVAAQEHDKNFEDFDLDSDGLVERNEFVDVFVKNYSADWDNTDDTGLDDEDFYLTNFTMLNKDENEYLDEAEWMFAHDYFNGDYLNEDYTLYDVDGDGYVEYNEYYDALYDSDYFLSWDVDRDGYLDQYELAYAVFDNWDMNDNYVLNRSEFNSFDQYYLDI